VSAVCARFHSPFYFIFHLIYFLFFLLFLFVSFIRFPVMLLWDCIWFQEGKETTTLYQYVSTTRFTSNRGDHQRTAPLNLTTWVKKKTQTFPSFLALFEPVVGWYISISGRGVHYHQEFAFDVEFSVCEITRTSLPSAREDGPVIYVHLRDSSRRRLTDYRDDPARIPLSIIKNHG
jgi:hypothetical protein